MPRQQKQTYSVHVYKPSGMRMCVLSYECTKAEVAINRAKKRIYQMGCLAHFYKFVPILAGV